MENIINELIELENNAAKVLESAMDYKNRLPDIIAEKSSEIIDGVNSEANARMQEMRRRIENETKLEIEAIKNKSKRTIMELERKFDENADKWEERVFNKIIGR